MSIETDYPEIRRAGIQHGEDVWRPNRDEIVIKNPYPGSTPEGAAFYLGVALGLDRASISYNLPK